MLLKRTLNLTAAVAVAALALSGPAPAQIRPNVATKDPVTGLSSSEWLAMIGNIVNGQSLVGIDGVLMVNAYPTAITVTCDRWSLVGSSPYIKGNPATLAPFSVTFVQTKGFDGYCKGGVVGHAGVRALTAKLDAQDGSFSGSTIVTFAPAE